MRRLKSWLLSLVAVGVYGTLYAETLAATESSTADLLENPLEPLVAKRSRTEQEDDHLAALAHFSAAHILNERDQRTEALRQYERSLRYAPGALPVLREMVPLADGLERTEEAMRYLAKYTEQHPDDPLLVERSATFLADSGEYQKSLELYRQLVRLLSNEPPSGRLIAAQKELAKLCLLCDQTAEAAAAMKQVLAALEKPEQFGVEPVAQKALVRDGDTYELLGTWLLDTHQADDARRAFEDLNRIRPDDRALVFHLAECDFVADKPDKALEQLEKYFTGNGPERAKEGIAPFELLAKILNKLGKQYELVSRAEALHKAHPDNPFASLFLGEQYRRLNKLDQAVQLLESSQPAEIDEQWSRALAAVYRQKGENEKLLRLLAQVLKKTESLSALGSEAKTIAEDKTAVDGLIAAADKLRAMSDQESTAFALRAAGLIAAEAKRWNDVEALFNQAMKLQPKSAGEMLLVWGVALTLDNKLAEAEKIFQRGIDERQFPDDNPILDAYLAGVLDLEGKTDAALAAAQVAVKKQPKSAKYKSRIPAILFHAKRYDEAAKAFQELIDQFQNDFSDDEVRETVREARLALSNIAVVRHELKPAVECLEQVLDEFPDDPGANNDLGYLWADNDLHLQRALRMIQFAVSAEPENDAYRDSLGWVLFRLDRYEEALVELQKATSSENPEGEVLDHLGETYRKLGKTAEANTAWKRAAKAFQKAGETEKMKTLEKKTESL
jgi:tetratricopeptide (TPR) repeat protein